MKFERTRYFVLMNIDVMHDIFALEIEVIYCYSKRIKIRVRRGEKKS